MSREPGGRVMWQTELLVPGRASGLALVLDEPLSLWGGLDPNSGVIIDARHPQTGICATGQVLVMRTGRGSSSASSVLLEAAAESTAPAAFILGEADDIITLGAVVASELYGVDIPVVVAPIEALHTLTTGCAVDLHEDGSLFVVTPTT